MLFTYMHIIYFHQIYSFLCPSPVTVFSGFHYCVLFFPFWCWDKNQDLMHARQASYPCATSLVPIALILR
jgi:hypothetical protein